MTLNLCDLAEAPVTFTSPLKDTSVPESETATFTCELSKPDKKVTWYKNGKEIVPDEHFEVKVEGTVHTLKVKDTALDDTAEYTVKLGEETSKAKLTVLGKYTFPFGISQPLYIGQGKGKYVSHFQTGWTLSHGPIFLLGQRSILRKLSER